MSDEIDLRPDERIIRSDMVVFYLSSTIGTYPNPMTKRGFLSMSLARMLITSERVVWLPPSEVPAWYRFGPLWLILSVSTFRRTPPLEPREAVELVDITRLWKWHPEFSGPPLVQAGYESWTFQLVEDRRPWNKFASKDAMREHLKALEAAWEAALSRETPH